MKFVKIFGMAALTLTLFAWFAFPARAVDENAAAEGVPAYDVARLKIFEGSAWVRTPDSGDWEEFPSNSPVPVRSLISIPDDSEAELQFHGGQFVLLRGGTDLDLRVLGANSSEFRLRSGEIRFYMPKSDFAPVRVALPAGQSADFGVPGRYWITAGDGESTLIVRDGEGTISGAQGEFHIQAGERAVIGGEVEIGRYSGEGADTFKSPPPLSEEEKQAGVPPAAAYELRDYGDWVYSSEYGYVWQPRVSAGWSPYYYGRWVWILPYGWTWVSEEPWGWYPYHYGYWYSDPFFGWVWCPFHAFVSFEFVFGGHHYHEFERHARFVPASVRFIRERGRVRWVPLRPGQRVRRIAFTRSDTRLASWNRPLRAGTVYVRGAGTRGGGWRDWTVVRGERRAVRAVPRVFPGARLERTRPGAERAVRGRGERSSGAVRERVERQPRETIRNTERPAGPERLQRESPSSLRPGRGSQVRPERMERTTPLQRYGIRVRQPVRPSVQARPGRTGRPSFGAVAPRAATPRVENRAARPRFYRETAPRTQPYGRSEPRSGVFSRERTGRPEGRIERSFGSRGGRGFGEREFGFRGRGGRGGNRFSR